MPFDPTVVQQLTDDEASVLSDALGILLDTLIDDVAMATTSPAEDVASDFASQHLPSRFADVYDTRLVRRLLVSLVVVSTRLSEAPAWPRCRAEELVLRAVIETANELHEERTGTTSAAIDDLVEQLFEDRDHEYLFTMAFDGVDDPSTDIGASLGTGSLHPRSWFDPFRTTEPVHPLYE